MYVMIKEQNGKNSGSKGFWGSYEENSSFIFTYNFSILLGCYSEEAESISHDCNFYGEGTHCKARLDFSASGKSTSTHYDEHQKEFLLEYKGDYSEVANSVVTYSYESHGAIEGGTSRPFGRYPMRSSSGGSGGDIQSKDKLIKVIVKWDGKEEIIPLEIQNDK